MCCRDCLIFTVHRTYRLSRSLVGGSRNRSIPCLGVVKIQRNSPYHFLRLLIVSRPRTRWSPIYVPYPSCQVSVPDTVTVMVPLGSVSRSVVPILRTLFSSTPPKLSPRSHLSTVTDSNSCLGSRSFITPVDGTKPSVLRFGRSYELRENPSIRPFLRELIIDWTFSDSTFNFSNGEVLRELHCIKKC